MSVREFFRRGGVLSKHLGQWEFRPGQLEMALEVEAAIDEKRHLIVEAGTGTGKTLAYLVPLIAGGRRVVVSTGTKNLQEQLFQKDVPFLEQALGRKLRVAYMKGRANFLCRQKLIDAERRPILEGLEEITEFSTIREWKLETDTGDRAELRTLPADSSLWPKLDSRRELCTGQKCDQFDRCFITKMHQRAREADIIIVNHHLFFADLALKQDDFGSVIPEYQVVVFDEAHDVENVAGQHFGIQLSSYRFDEVARDIQAVAIRGDFGSGELDRVVNALRIRAGAFFTLFDAVQGRQGFRNRQQFAEKYEEEYSGLLIAVQAVASQLKLVRDRTDEVLPLEGRTSDLESALRMILEGDDATFVYWIEKRGRGVFLQATPIDVSQILAERLFGNIDSVVMTSATLAVNSGFDFTKSRLGVESPRELLVPGHFDYRNQVLFYVPEHLPDPRDPLFNSRAADEVERLLGYTQGRAFVLFTSYQQMRIFYDRLSFALEFPCLMQGQAPNSALLDEFRETPNCVLFATASFWQGVDVPGDALSAVIIDKLPFAVPSDPVVDARIRKIRQDGGNPFEEYQIPAAVLALKQGFGRLIRSSADRGILSLLDSRILKKAYGKTFLDSLPDYTFTTQAKDVEDFFEA